VILAKLLIVLRSSMLLPFQKKAKFKLYLLCNPSNNLLRGVDVIFPTSQRFREIVTHIRILLLGGRAGAYAQSTQTPKHLPLATVLFCLP
jgi:hypothetical protein